MNSAISHLAPELTLVAAATIIILGEAFVPKMMGRNSTISVAVAGLLAAMIFAIPMAGQNTVAFGGSLAVDTLSFYFTILLAGATILVVLASADHLDALPAHRAEFMGLLLMTTAALMVLAAAHDLITAFIALEMSSISIAFLAAWNKRDLKSTEAGLKFFLLSAMSSTVLLYGMALVYGATGQLSFDRIAQELIGAPTPGLLLAIAFLIAGFGFKVSAVPFQMWTPDVYEGAITPVTTYLSVASKAGGFAILIRVFSSALPSQQQEWAPMLAAVALATMTIGNLVALVQTNIKRMLAYSSIAHAGYILVGLASSTDQGIAASLFYLLAYAATNLGAFIAVMALANYLGSETILDYRGLKDRQPWLAFAMAISLLSLAGLPPFVGFFGKLFIFSAAATSGLTWLVLAALVNSAISLYYYAQVIWAMYIASPAADSPQLLEPRREPGALVMISLNIAVAGILVLGITSGAILGLQQVAASGLGR